MHPLYEKANKVSAEVYEAALEVQKYFGVGLPESLYQKCLARELQLRGHSAETEVIVPKTCKNASGPFSNSGVGRAKMSNNR